MLYAEFAAPQRPRLIDIRNVIEKTFTGIVDSAGKVLYTGFLEYLPEDDTRWQSEIIELRPRGITSEGEIPVTIIGLEIEVKLDRRYYE